MPIQHWELSEVHQYFTPTELFADVHLAMLVHTMHLEHILGDIETNSGHLHCLLPLLSVSAVFSLL
jgi:hypothetical protein